MGFTELYQRILPLWGERLHFDDGLLIEHKNPFLALGKLKGQTNPAAAAGEHFHSEKFSASWKQAQHNIAPNDALGNLMLWSQYQVFQRHSKALAEKGVFELPTQAIDPAEVEVQFLKNLHEPGWEEERDLFEIS